MAVFIFSLSYKLINIPVNIKGNAIGVRNGGRLAQNMRRMLVEALSVDLPETIEVDITNLKIGESIRVLDMELENVNFLNAKKIFFISLSLKGPYHENQAELI